MAEPNRPLVAVSDLSVAFTASDGRVTAVDRLSLDIHPGRTLAVVGESGSGKSTTALAIGGLLPPTAVVAGEIRVGETDVMRADAGQLRRMHGLEVGFVFQDPTTALSPYRRIGDQLVDTVRWHDRSVSRRAARRQAVELLDRVGIPDARGRIDDFPHQFSGGMRQRAVIALALINKPRLLIADEPTAALDVTVGRQILDLMLILQADLHMAILIITHDLGVVARVADEVLVLYAGRECERGALVDVFDRPAHPYTAGLRAAVPRLDDPIGALLPAIPGSAVSAADAGPGCAFAGRCRIRPSVGDRCLTEMPVPTRRPGTPVHRASCHHPGDLSEGPR